MWVEHWLYVEGQRDLPTNAQDHSLFLLPQVSITTTTHVWRFDTSRVTPYWWTETYLSSVVLCVSKIPGKEPWLLRARHYQPLPPTVCITWHQNLPRKDSPPHVLPDPQNKHQSWNTHHQGGSLGSVSLQWCTKTSPVRAATLIYLMIPQDSISTKSWDAQT